VDSFAQFAECVGLGVGFMSVGFIREQFATHLETCRAGSRCDRGQCGMAVTADDIDAERARHHDDCDFGIEPRAGIFVQNSGIALLHSKFTWDWVMEPVPKAFFKNDAQAPVLRILLQGGRVEP
jgi:hypothetical protein